MTRARPVIIALCCLSSPALADGPTPAAPAAPTTPTTTCKAWNGAKCCDPTVTAHLPVAAVMKACGQSEASYAGEVASKDTCKYVFKVGAEPPEGTTVQVYAQPVAGKDPPTEPVDPFFVWKKLGKVFLADRAKAPPAAKMIASAIGLWMAGKGYVLSVNASTRVCPRAAAPKLAKAMR